MIKLTFVKNQSGKYDLSLNQNGKNLFVQEYDASKKYTSGWKNQATLFTAYVKFVQRKINEELDKNPNFHFNGYKEFKKYAGSRMINDFFDHEAEYMPKE
jgi:hypothetical protein